MIREKVQNMIYSFPDHTCINLECAYPYVSDNQGWKVAYSTHFIFYQHGFYSEGKNLLTCKNYPFTI